jgi:long-chain acyl-CoA synthetase
MDAPKFVSMTYEEAYQMAERFGSGLVQLLGLKPHPQDLAGQEPLREGIIGIYMKNNYQWAITDHASMMYSLTTVCMHDSFDAQALTFIMNHTEMSSVLCTLSHLKPILAVKPAAPHLKNILLADDTLTEDSPEFLKVKAQLQELGLKWFFFNQILDKGTKSPLPKILPTGSDVFTICYTSGTTGNPKGVLITHSNLVEGGKGLLASVPSEIVLTEKDSHLSFLPLSHVFERMIFHSLTWLGCEIGFQCGNHDKYQRDLHDFKPTFFPTVPRVMTKLYDKVMATVKDLSPFKQYMFNKALQAKKDLLKRGM